MRIFFAGPLTELKNPLKTKAFYRRLAQVATDHGFSYYWAFLNGTDPVANPHVPPKTVYAKDIGELAKSNFMVAYVGEPSTGTGLEIEFANAHGIAVYILYEKEKKISRMLRGCPAIKGELCFASETDALTQFDALLKELKH